MSVSRLHDPSLSRGVATTTWKRPDLAASQPPAMLFVHSGENPASTSKVFSRSMSQSSSDTIRIPAGSGTSNGKLKRGSLSQAIRLTVYLLHLTSFVLLGAASCMCLGRYKSHQASPVG